MAKQSASSVALDALVSGILSPAMRERGFRRRGRSFSKAAADVYHCVDVQASRSNTPMLARFVVNISVVWPRWHAVWTGLRFPTNPVSAAAVVTERVGATQTRTDAWWTVTHATDIAELGAAVLPAVTRSMESFFNCYPSSEGLLAAFDSKTKVPTHAPLELLYATLLVDAGRSSEAQEQLTIAARKRPSGIALEGVARRLGLQSGD